MDIEEEIREAFRCFDKKKDMDLSLFQVTFTLPLYSYCLLYFVELTRVLEKLGDKLSFEETQVCFYCAPTKNGGKNEQEFMLEADLDGDGNINYEEFVTMLFKVKYEQCQANNV